ncbi:calcium-translocating P-type ATPase [Lojkania enalia]|uniref:Calcium-transporting ATPase n=1 Tax=Lojkania enalia TaxID=147567 RepID=A0A9P4K7P5_9PLEO|nr:calcium-translocating P-type ATPase [Didymosphaeria enalia]
MKVWFLSSPSGQCGQAANQDRCYRTDRPFKSTHSRDRFAEGFSSTSTRNPFTGRGRAPSEATPVPSTTSAGVSIYSGISGKTTYTLESQLQGDALKPDSGSESDFAIGINRFAFSPGQLNKLLSPKSLPAFIALGGLPGIETGLRTDVDASLSLEQTELPSSIAFREVTRQSGSHSREAFYDRKRIFSPNESVLILLTVAAVISLALGLYETFGVDHRPDAPPSIDWIEVCAICVSIVVVVLVGAINYWQKDRAFIRLNAKKEALDVKAILSGKLFIISVYDILVGDVLHLEPRDLVPADGIFNSGHNVLRLLESGHSNGKDLDPFIISGSKVLKGIGAYLVISIGIYSSYGRILMAMRHDPKPTPLQMKLDGLARTIAKLATAASFFLLLVLFVTEKASKAIDFLIVSVTIIVVAVLEGLLLAITLSLAFITTQTVKMNNLTGTPTQNKTIVVTGTFNKDSFDDKNPEAAKNRSSHFAQRTTQEQKSLLIQSIAINTTAFEGEGGEFDFIDSKTETALLGFTRNVLGMDSLSQERSSAHVVQMLPFDSSRKCMGAVQKLPNGAYRLLVKGASEILLSYSSTVALPTGQAPIDGLQTKRITPFTESCALQSLRTTGLIYKNFPQWPPHGTENPDDLVAVVDLSAPLNGMIFLGVVGIQDPIRPGVPEAIAKCKHAGIVTRTVTGDNVVTAKAIATYCGVYTDEIVMDGPDFRWLSDEDMNGVLPRLQALVRSSPEDKRILVTQLKALGGIVAVTGDGTNDGPALKAADVSFSMGIAGTEVVMEASAIVLMDGNFASILTALIWGRAVNDAMQKFLQFQTTFNITAMVVAFITAVEDPKMRSVLTAMQLLWINLFMDSLAALSLSTDAPTDEILDCSPTPRSASIISIAMWKMIIGQTIYQVIATFYNNRRLDNRLNAFANLHKNYYFITMNN